MDNMGTFSEYYDGVEGAASAAADKLSEVEKSLVAIANLKAVWGEDDISAKKIILDATKRYTGLNDLTYDNFLQRFEKLTADGLGLDQDTLSAWTDMSNALRAYNDAQTTVIKRDVDFYNNILQQIDDTFTGSMSTLSSYDKAAYAEQRALAYQADGDTTNYLKMLQTQLDSERKMSRTKEEYERSLIRYREELRTQKPDSIENKQLESLEDLNQKLENIEEILDNENIIYYQGQSA
jgi:hypothetical protein